MLELRIRGDAAEAAGTRIGHIGEKRAGLICAKTCREEETQQFLIGGRERLTCCPVREHSAPEKKDKEPKRRL